MAVKFISDAAFSPQNTKTQKTVHPAQDSLSPAATCKSAGDLCPTADLSEALCTWRSAPDARPVEIGHGNFVELSPRQKQNEVTTPSFRTQAFALGELVSGLFLILFFS